MRDEEEEGNERRGGRLKKEMKDEEEEGNERRGGRGR